MEIEELEARTREASDRAARTTTLTLSLFLNDHGHEEAAAFLLRHARESMTSVEFGDALRLARSLRAAARRGEGNEDVAG